MMVPKRDNIVLLLPPLAFLLGLCRARPPGEVLGAHHSLNSVDSQMSNLIITMAGRLGTLEAEVEELKRRVNEQDQYMGGTYGHTTGRIDGPPPLDCDEIRRRNVSATTGIYYIKPRGTQSPFKAYCQMDPPSGSGESRRHPAAWTVIQRRGDGSEDFNRDWRDYSRGFGNLSSEFWLGLEPLHSLLQQYPYRLRVDLLTWDGARLFAEYAGFALGSRKGNYRLRIDSYLGGNATNALSYHAGSPFTTADRDNDQSSVNCAVVHHGGWWFRSCDRSNLNGLYRADPHYNGVWDDGIEWKAQDGPPHYSYRATEMKVRPMTDDLA